MSEPSDQFPSGNQPPGTVPQDRGSRFVAPPQAGTTPGVDADFRPYLPTAHAPTPTPGNYGHQPLGVPDPAQSQPRPSIDQYRPHRSKATYLVGLLAVAVVAALLWFGTRPPTNPASVTSPSPTAQSPNRPASPSNSSITVESERDGAKATWEIVKVVWDATGVTVTTRITVDSGTLRYQFSALDSRTAQKFDAVPASGTGALSSGRLTEGAAAQGTLRFNKPRGDTMIYMRDSIGNQITALTIQG